MPDPLLPTDALERLKARLTDAVLARAIGMSYDESSQGVTDLLGDLSDMRAVLAEALAPLLIDGEARTPPSCATCRFGRIRTVDDQGKAARACHHPTIRYRFDDEGLGQEAHFPEGYGCNYHDPLPAPPSSPEDEEKRGLSGSADAS